MDAREIERAQDALCWQHPSLARYVSRLVPESLPIAAESAFATDGAHIFFDSRTECAFDHLKRVLLHMIAHCLLGHLWMKGVCDLACDAQAWLFSEEIAPETALSGIAQEFRRRLKGAETLSETREILETDAFLITHFSELRALISLDSHALWGVSSPKSREKWGEGHSQAHRRGQHGTSAGNQALEWQPARVDADALAKYLLKYAVLRENAREDPDDFQPAWYLYGLEHYGNIPLIEPSESREERRLETLAVVIDTSGSCARGLTQQFLSLLCRLLEESGLFFRRFNLRVIQCDARVQRDDAIADLRAFERYIENLELRGGGGTDFRPAFERIDALVDSGALRGLKGVLFFSDGRGIFPQKPPKYETTFVFLKHRFDAIDVPEWVQRLVIEAPTPIGGEYMEY